VVEKIVVRFKKEVNDLMKMVTRTLVEGKVLGAVC